MHGAALGAAEGSGPDPRPDRPAPSLRGQRGCCRAGRSRSWAARGALRSPLSRPAPRPFRRRCPHGPTDPRSVPVPAAPHSPGRAAAAELPQPPPSRDARRRPAPRLRAAPGRDGNCSAAAGRAWERHGGSASVPEGRRFPSWRPGARAS